MTIEYVRMDSTHIDDVANLEKLCFTIPWSAHSFDIELKNKVAYYLVAICDGSVVGYGGVWQVAGEGHITNIATHPQYRRMGVGAGILSKLIEFARTNNLEFLTLEVRKSNQAAQKLYEKFGFKVAGERKRYYEDNNEDAIIMTKTAKTGDGSVSCISF